MYKLVVLASVLVVVIGQGGYGGGGHGGGGYGGGNGGGGYGGGNGGGGYGGGQGGGGGGHGGGDDGGYGGGHDHAQPTPYKYGYEIQGGDHHNDFKQSRNEHSDGHGHVEGSYSYTDSHGNKRQVDYVADHDGFRAKVRTNEPGTDKQNPADVDFHADPPSHSSYGNGGGNQGGYGDGGYGGGQGGYGGGQGGHGGGQGGYGGGQGGYGGGQGGYGGGHGGY